MSEAAALKAHLEAALGEMCAVGVEFADAVDQVQMRKTGRCTPETRWKYEKAEIAALGRFRAALRSAQALLAEVTLP